MGPEQPNHFFSKHSRLKRSGEYRAVFERSQIKVAHPHYLLLAKLNKRQCSRLGLAVSKKQIPTAVERNRLKRAVRETFRQSVCRPSVDVVFLARRTINGKEKGKTHTRLKEAWKRLSEEVRRFEIENK